MSQTWCLDSAAGCAIIGVALSCRVPRSGDVAMSDYSKSYGPDERVPLPRTALAYVAGAAALLFAIGCAITAVLYLGANRTAEEAVAARAAAEEKQREADKGAQESQRQALAAKEAR